MPRGRPRAVSSSTVATTDTNHINFVRETKVLKPTPAKLHSDQWPCFVLTNATVHNKNGEMVNMFHVDLEGPFTIRGKLELDQDQTEFLIKSTPKYKPTWIEVPESVSYAVALKEAEQGEMEQPVLWASGQSGWFEIVPSPAYAPICTSLFEGICLHYSIETQYMEEAAKQSKRKKPIPLQDVNLPLDDLFFKYAVGAGDGVTKEEVIQRCKLHAMFLLQHSPKGTGFHNWLTREFPDLVTKLAKKGGKPKGKAAVPDSSVPESEPETKPETKQPRRQNRNSSSTEAADAKGKAKAASQSSVPRNLRSAPAKEVEVSSDEQQSRTSRSTRLRNREAAAGAAKNTPGLEDRVEHTGDETTSPDTKMHVATAEPTPADGSIVDFGIPKRMPKARRASLIVLLEVLNEIRASLLTELGNKSRKKHPDEIPATGWHTKVYLACSIKSYHAGREICEYYAQDLVKYLGPQWHASDLYRWATENVDTKPKFEYIDAAGAESLVKRKKVSREPVKKATDDAVPRTPVTSHSGKQLMRGRLSGKAAGLRPSTISKKRLRDVFEDGDDDEEDDDDDDEMDLDGDRRPKKTAKTSEFFENDDSSEEESEDDDEDDEDISLAKKQSEPLARLLIRSQKLPSTIPTGPNNTWTCEEEDCGYVVRAADEEEGQTLIYKHLEAHAEEATNEARELKVNLAMQESRGHMPINHLLEKIRERGENSQKRDQVSLNGQVLPQPIKRSLLV